MINSTSFQKPEESAKNVEEPLSEKERFIGFVLTLNKLNFCMSETSFNVYFLG